MKENTIPEIVKIIDEATTPIIIMVVSELCNEFKPKIQEDVEAAILENNKAVAMFTVCYPEDSITFPRPVTPILYYYIPKNQIPIFHRTGNIVSMIPTDIEVAEKMMAGMTHDDARYTDEQKKQIAEFESELEKEKVADYPPKIKQVRNLVREIWTTAKRGLGNLPVIASVEEGQRRLAICDGCDRFDHEANRCRECGCMMAIKSQMAGSTCPLNKW